MDNRIKNAIKWIFDLILSSVGFLFLGRVIEMFTSYFFILSWEGIVGLLSIIGATGLTVYLVLNWNKKPSNIEPWFAHLTIHYLRHGTRGYITNNVTNQAYWVSDLLESCVRQHKIPIHRHDNKNGLQKYFNDNSININERDPLPKELGLRYRYDKSFVWATDKMDSELFSKLEGHKLNDLQIALIYPWYYSFFSTAEHDQPNKRLLLKFSTKKAYESPRIDIDLIEKRIIDCQIYAFRKPFESLETFSKRYGYTLIRRHFTEKELLQEAMDD